MDRYKLFREVGDGTFGNVWRAMNKLSGEVVAIKKMKKKYYSWEECINLREVKSLQKMNHPNIVKLKEVIHENDILYFVFEYMDWNLYQLIKGRDELFSEAEIRKWCFQVFQGLAYMHRRGYFHRDLKPENLLVNKEVIKVADLGLAREITSRPPYTEYVSTRWYRAPEVLLQSYLYNFKVDMWAMGAIMAEMFTLRPLFPGSSEADEIHKICSVIGSPTQKTWAEGLRLSESINYQFPQFAGVDLSVLVPSASVDAISLIKSLCSWDPCKRPTAIEALHHPFFQTCYYIPPSLRPKQADSRIWIPPPVARAPLQQQNGSTYPGTVPNSKLTGNLSSTRLEAVDAGALLGPSIVSEDSKNKKEKSCTDTFVRQQGGYHPPGMNRQSNESSGRAVVGGWGSATNKFGSVNIIEGGGPRRREVVPPPMKAGREWRDAPVGNMYLLRRPQPPHRSSARKVMG